MSDHDLGDHLVPVQLLGQSGCKLNFPAATLYLDPYLSNSVQELDAADLVRLQPTPIVPTQVDDADWVLITHSHIDHCDPHTLPDLVKASPECKFIGPAPVYEILKNWGISPNRLVLIKESWIELTPQLSLRAIPAAHPEIRRDADGNLAEVGYLLDFAGKYIYLAGDTSVVPELITVLASFQPIDTAFLPVNERNYFREQRGIIGNMSIREAFILADTVNIHRVIPVHWDMFAVNAVYVEEIKAVYNGMKPSFEMDLFPTHI